MNININVVIVTYNNLDKLKEILYGKAISNTALD